MGIEKLQQAPVGWIAAPARTHITAELEVAAFVARFGLGEESKQTLDQIIKVFNSPEKITIEIIASPEDDSEGGERIVFNIKCDLDRQAFRHVSKEFYAQLRSEKSPIYGVLVVLRDI